MRRINKGGLQWLHALAALPEDPDLIPSTQTANSPVHSDIVSQKNYYGEQLWKTWLPCMYVHACVYRVVHM